MSAHLADQSSPPPPLGRPRARLHHLPPRMTEKPAGTYWYVCNGKPRRWIPLGRDLAQAKRQWAVLETGKAPSLQVGEFLERFVREHDCALSTRKQYAYAAAAIGTEFTMPVADLRAEHVALFKRKYKAKPAWTNQCIALLAVAWWQAKEEGLTAHDWRVRKLEAKRAAAREREMTDDEFTQLRSHGPGWLRVAMDLAYLTAARPSDIRGLQWSAVAETVAIRQRKTGARQSFAMSEELRCVIDEARQRRVLGLYVVADDKGRQISKQRLEAAFRAAREAAGVPDVQFRDIRAKSATEAERRGQDYQKLLGHTSPKMSERYLKGRRVEQVEPLRKKL